MSDYTTYDYYTNSYYGSLVSESDFPKYLFRATHKLNELTFMQIDDEAMETYATEISNATCALIDWLYNIDYATENATSADGGNIKSMSSGGESITFGDNNTIYTSVLSDIDAQNVQIRKIVNKYLMDTGLLYAGV